MWLDLMLSLMNVNQRLVGCNDSSGVSHPLWDLNSLRSPEDFHGTPWPRGRTSFGHVAKDPDADDPSKMETGLPDDDEAWSD